MDKYEQLLKYSNPQKVLKNLHRYLPNTQLYTSSRKDKKYMIKDLDDKWIHFGQMGYEDYTKHMNRIRRNRYWKRASNIKGDWIDNKYSPNMLSLMTLWT